MKSKVVEQAITRLFRPYYSSSDMQKSYKDFNGDKTSIDIDIHLIEEYIKQLENQVKGLSNKMVTEGYLQNWYINSINTEIPPKWSEEHIEELCRDFDVYVKDDISEI